MKNRIKKVQRKIINREELTATEEKLFDLDAKYSTDMAAKKAIKLNL